MGRFENDSIDGKVICYVILGNIAKQYRKIVTNYLI